MASMQKVMLLVCWKSDRGFIDMSTQRQISGLLKTISTNRANSSEL